MLYKMNIINVELARIRLYASIAEVRHTIVTFRIPFPEKEIFVINHENFEKAIEYMKNEGYYFLQITKFPKKEEMVITFKKEVLN